VAGLEWEVLGKIVTETASTEYPGITTTKESKPIEAGRMRGLRRPPVD
jgi:hypothetical protein